MRAGVTLRAGSTIGSGRAGVALGALWACITFCTGRTNCTSGARVAFLTLQRRQLRRCEIRISERRALLTGVSLRASRPLWARLTLRPLGAGITLRPLCACFTLCTGRAGISLGAFQRTHVHPCRLVHIPLIRGVAVRRTNEPRVTGASCRVGSLQSRQRGIQALYRVAVASRASVSFGAGGALCSGLPLGACRALFALCSLVAFFTFQRRQLRHRKVCVSKGVALLTFFTCGAGIAFRPLCARVTFRALRSCGAARACCACVTLGALRAGIADHLAQIHRLAIRQCQDQMTGVLVDIHHLKPPRDRAVQPCLELRA